MSLFSIEGQVAVITGGTGALGTSVSNFFAKNGVKVAILNRNPEATQRRVDELKQITSEVMGISCDVLDESSLITARDQVMKKWGHIDILVNGAGGNVPGATVAPTSNFFNLEWKEYKKAQDLNLDGTILPSLIFGKVMAQQKTGNIINISSMAALSSITRVVGYSVAKAGVSNFTQWLAMEVAMKFGEGIRVNALAPGFFIGEQNRRLLTNEDGSLTQRGQQVIDNTPMKRFGDVEELNGTIQFLCSKAASFITGTVIPIDGGFSIYSGV